PATLVCRATTSPRYRSPGARSLFQSTLIEPSLSEQRLRRVDNVLRRQVKLLVQLLIRRRCTIMVEADGDAALADPLVPRHRLRCFDRDALDPGWQHAVAICLILFCEQLH